jgi:hypothetical protein
LNSRDDLCAHKHAAGAIWKSAAPRRFMFS